MSDIDTITEARWSDNDLAEAISIALQYVPDGKDLDRIHELVKSGTSPDRLQAQQSNAEPVAWAYFGDFPDGKRLISADNTNLWGSDGIPLYAHPPASTEPRLTVEQAMEVVEPFIDAEAEMEDGARWNWESKHKKYREMIEEIRDRLTKAAKQST